MKHHTAERHLPRKKLEFCTPTCVECGALGSMTSGERLFPDEPKRRGQMFFACVCGAWVSCHRGTAIPTGRPASAHTRWLRYRAHQAFDAVWGKDDGRSRIATGYARSKAYRWLARELGLSRSDCHMGVMDAATCERVIALCGARTGAQVAAKNGEGVDHAYTGEGA